MKKEIPSLYVIYIMTFFLSGCNDSAKKYYLKDQWQTSSIKYFQVKNKPKEVKEYFYAGENNLSQNSLKKFQSYDLFTYDKEGNLLARKLFFSDDLWYEFKYTYSKKGYEVEFITKSTKGLTRKKITDFEVISDSIYQENLYDDSLVNDVRIYRYKDSGNEIFKEQSVEAKEYKRKSKTHYWYNGQQILKEIFETADPGVNRSIEKQYYYDKNNYLDSIIKRTGKDANVTVFKKNKYGDPISEIWKSSKDTLAYKTYTYLYDSNNNWIRRLEENHQPSGFNPPEKAYSLIIREIKY